MSSSHVGTSAGLRYVGKERKGICFANIKSTLKGVRSDIQNTVSIV